MELWKELWMERRVKGCLAIPAQKRDPNRM
jgi:hypothetical protein